MARSVVNQVVLLQKETTPGTAAVNAMKRLLSMKLTPSYNVDGTQSFKASGHKVNTIVQLGDMWSTWNVEGIQDFNNIGFVLASIYGPPTTTTPSGGTTSKQHVFNLNPSGADPQVSYTAQYGDSVQALQSTYFMFQGLDLGIERGNLSFSSSAISRKYTKGATLATTGVTDVPAVPIPQQGYDVFADDTWADLGTTKLLAAYSGNVSNGDKFVPDRPLNSAVSGFETLMEAEDISYSGSLTLGMDTAGVAMLDTMEAEAIKFLRFKADGPLIEATVKYSIMYDLAVRITNVGEITKAPNSPAVSLPFDFEFIKDPTSGKVAQVTLVNTIASY